MLTQLLVNSTREEIFNHMRKSRLGKFSKLLYGIRAFEHIPGKRREAQLLSFSYAGFRRIDDIVDGDLPIPDGQTRVDYLNDRIRFVEHGGEPSDAADHLLLRASRIAEELGHAIMQDALAILYSLRFDAERYGTRKIFPQQELEEYFFRLDIEGTIKGALRVFWENVDKYEQVIPLGKASRIFYNLRDLEEDLEAGFVNIAEEDMRRLNIPERVLTEADPGAAIRHSGVQRWAVEQAEQGLGHLAEHHRQMQDARFSLLATIAFYLIYERPARQCFEQVEQGKYIRLQIKD